METPPISPHPPNTKFIQWKQVFICQDWASIFVNMFIVLALIIVSSTISDTADRSFLTYDATIANEYHPHSTIPFWLAIVFPLICMILSLACYEYVAYSRNFNSISKTSCVATALHFFIDFIFAAVVTSLITEVSKLLVGRYRPDWLSRCGPVTNSTEIPSWGLSPSLNPACTSDLSSSKLEDGHKSFPSGHSSNAFAMAVYIAGYVLYSTYFRAPRRYYQSRQEGSSTPWKQRISTEMATSASFLWVLFNISWAWGVGISRIIDNKHHPSDVIGGGFLGTVIGGCFILRAVPRHFIVIPEEEIEEQQRQERYQQQPLLLDTAPPHRVVNARSTSRLDA